jgi:hypothetical protein
MVGSCGYGIDMPRSARRSVGGEVYHVLNRAALRHPIFKREKDFAAFGRRKGVIPKYYIGMAPFLSPARD